MKKSVLLPFTLISVFGTCCVLPGCEDDSYTDQEEVPQNVKVSTTIRKETAKKDALSAAKSFLSGQDGIQRTIESVAALMGGEKNTDTIAYACNFAENAGFVIVAADSRVNDRIVVCADQGRFSEDSDNPGFSMLLDHIKNYTERKIAAAAAKSEKKAKSLKKLTADGDSLIELPAQQVGPLIKTAWNQIAPYNAFIDTCPSSGTPYYTGCTLTALAQLIGYYNQPGIEMMPEMTAQKYAYDLDDFHKIWVGILFRCLWRDLPKVFNNCAVGVDGYKAMKYLQEYGYQTQASTFYSSQSILKSVAESHPVMVTSATFSGGHTWLMDGYRTEQYRSASDSTNVVKGDTYYHINWGWGGDCDGWFAGGCFDVDAAVEYDEYYHINRNRNYMDGLTFFYAWPKPQEEAVMLNTDN